MIIICLTVQVSILNLITNVLNKSLSLHLVTISEFLDQTLYSIHRMFSFLGLLDFISVDTHQFYLLLVSITCSFLPPQKIVLSGPGIELFLQLPGIQICFNQHFNPLGLIYASLGQSSNVILES